ncbi:MAG TPA: hypothetical protein VEW07_01630 [Solirubrobacterales bacterium]|nr:hypothetical protein [Solirubrobacterales bacterium]
MAVAPATVRAEGSFVASPSSIVKGEPTGANIFTAAAVKKECGKADFHGTLSGSSRTLELEPIYDDCTAKVLGGLPVKFVIGSCFYQLHHLAPLQGKDGWKAEVNLTCPTEFQLQWNIYETAHGFDTGSVICTTSMPSQSNIGTAVLSNREAAADYIAIRWNLRQIKYRAYGNELLCGSSFGEVRHDAAFTGTTRVAAENPGGQPVDLTVRG